MMILKSSDAREIMDNFNESKKVKDFIKSLSQIEQQKMHNIFNNIKKAAMQGDSSIVVDNSYFTNNMLSMIEFLGYEFKNSELTW